MFATFPEKVLIVLGLLLLIWWETSARVWGEGWGTLFLPMSPSFHHDSGYGWNMPAENWVQVQTDNSRSEPRKTRARASSVGLCDHTMCSWAPFLTLVDLRLAPYTPPLGYMCQWLVEEVSCGRCCLSLVLSPHLWPENLDPCVLGGCWISIHSAKEGLIKVNPITSFNRNLKEVSYIKFQRLWTRRGVQRKRVCVCVCECTGSWSDKLLWGQQMGVDGDSSCIPGHPDMNNHTEAVWITTLFGQ